MIHLGKIQTLTASKVTPQGFYLSDEEGNEVLLPQKFVPETLRPGQNIEVFIFNDSEDRLTATTQKPLIELGRAAILTVIDVTNFGYFLDWNLDKHLLLPKNESLSSHEKGDKVAVTLFLDIKTNRLAASEVIDRYLKNHTVNLKEGDKVNLIVFRKTPLGYSVVVENRYMGLIHNNHAFRRLNAGETTTGYVLKIRPDNNIDIVITKPGYQGHDEATEKILQMLQETPDGFLPFNDNSPAESIANHFNMSKKLFKKSIGTLYKIHRIDITDKGIKLIPKP